MALSAGALMAPGIAFAGKKSFEIYQWNGRALGAETSIQLYSDDKIKADNVLKNVAALINQYEKIFSLYDDASETSLLNNDGMLKGASAEFVELTQISKDISLETNGAFDITVQPLWDLYQSHFEHGNEDAIESKVTDVVAIIGSDKININGNDISFAKKAMAVSFNGIAQGFITDKVTEYLSEQGFKNALVDMGEYRATGPQHNGEAWRIGLLNPFDAISINDVVEIKSGAVATSGGYGNQFDASGKHHHLFNPKTGLSSALYASVTVTAKDAVTADALSTAFSNMSVQDIEKTINRFDGLQARLTMNDGRVVRL